jgi:hypothetical protein
MGVQTGTFADGTATHEDCDGWTNASDDFDETFGSQSLARSHRWTEGLQNGCNNTRRIYCFANVVTLFWDGFESAGTANWSTVVP